MTPHFTHHIEDDQCQWCMIQAHEPGIEDRCALNPAGPAEEAELAAFKAGFCAHYGKGPGDWVFDAETCVAKDLWEAAYKQWLRSRRK